MALFNGRNNYQGVFPQVNPYSPYPVPYGYAPQLPQPQQSQYYVQAVSNAKEAEACSIPMDGSVVIFPDKANNKIYTKQVNMNTGEGVFKEYVIAGSEVAETPAEKYALKSDILPLSQEIERIKGEILTLTKSPLKIENKENKEIILDV